MAVRYPRLDVIFSDRPASRVEHRPSQPAPPDPDQPGLVVNCEQRRVTVDGRELVLTFMEFELIAYLVARPLRVHSRRLLMEVLWGRPDNGDTRTVAVHIARIRHKLGPALRPTIATVRQVGYKYDPRLAATP